jgi:ParB family chromosome partitioning protein
MPAVSRETAAVSDDLPTLRPVPGARFLEIPIDQISPNPRQPRQVFDSDELVELAASIREVGVLQPVVVRHLSTARGTDEISGTGEVTSTGVVEGRGSRYELIMGERRWRASQLAGLAAVPAIVRETGDDELLRDALLENLHRSQLNALEEAAAYAQLLEDFGCTHDELARRIGRSRPQISNTIRLLRLPPQVQRRVAAGVLTAGHARALLALDDAAQIERLATRVVAEGMSVRAVEEAVALGGPQVAVPSARRPAARRTPPAAGRGVGTTVRPLGHPRHHHSRASQGAAVRRVRQHRGSRPHPGGARRPT